MKLAEALIIRADQQKRLEQLKQRLLRNAKAQEGDEPAEDPQALLREFEQVAAALVRLIQQINRTNAATAFENGDTLSDILARRDVLRLRQDAFRSLAEAATIEQSRFTRSEVRFLSTVQVAVIQRQADELAQENRELDARIQSANWATEMQEA